jgi:hypothetical protein
MDTFAYLGDVTRKMFFVSRAFHPTDQQEACRREKGMIEQAALF